MLGGQRAVHGQGQFEQPGHAADEVGLLDREPFVVPGEDQVAGVRSGPAGGDGVAVADIGYRQLVQLAVRDGEQFLLGYLLGGKAHRGGDVAVDDDHRDLGLQRLRCPLGRTDHGGRLVRQRRHHRQQLDELLDLQCRDRLDHLR